MKSHRILKSLAGLTACLSALGTPGSVFAAKSNPSPKHNSNETITTPPGTSAESQDTKVLKKEPPENRISKSLLSKFEESIGLSKIKYDRKTGKVIIAIPIAGSPDPVLIDKTGIKTKKDLAAKVCREVLKKGLDSYMKSLGAKTFMDANDNDFSDWKFLQPKLAASDMRKSYEYTIKMRRKLGQDFKNLEKSLPKDELGLFVDKIIKENGLLDVEFPPDFYRLIDGASRGSRNLSNDFESDEVYE